MRALSPDAILRELRQALRGLLRAPGFTLAAVVVLALGVGAATAAWGVAQAVLFAPLPYADALQLFTVYEADSTGARRVPSWPTVREWTAQSAAFESLAYVRGDAFAVRNDEGTLLLLAAYATPELFDALRVTPLRGRTFDAAESRAGAPVAVLSWHLWRDQFGGDEAIVGRTVSTAAGPFTVIGVMPEGVRYPAWADLWLPQGALSADGRAAIERRDLHVDAVTVGRLAPGVTTARATAELRRFNERAAEVHADARGWTRIDLRSVRSEVVGDATGRVALLAGATALLLLIACVNVAGLLVARAATWERELSVRAALGASRRRLTAQLFTESVLLAGAGGALGVAVAAALLRLLASRAGGALPRLDMAALDVRALTFALATSAATALLFGMLPARRAARVAPMDALRASHGSSAGPGAARIRTVLVVAEIALASVLVVGATSLAAALLERLDADLGFEPAGVVTLRAQPPSPRYDAPAAARALYERLEGAVAAVPGVTDVALVNHLPLSGTSMPTAVRTSRVPDAEERPWALYRAISANWFDMMRVQLTAGRAPTPQEVSGAAPVAVVNEAFARREWPDADAVGQSMTVRRVAQGRADFGEEMTLTVVGVARDTRSFGPDAPEPPVVYAPWTLAIWTSLFVAARVDPRATGPVLDDVRAAIQSVDPSIPVAGPGFSSRVRPMEAYAGNLLRTRRLGTALLGGFAAAALVLATVGLFGVLAWVVVQRTREFGVRAALGASRGALLRLVLESGARLVGIGLGLGFAGAFVLGRIAGAATPDLAPTRPATFIVAGALFAAAALLACLVPAVRASRVAPARILRDEG